MIVSIDPALTLETKVFRKVKSAIKVKRVAARDMTLVSQILLKINEAGNSILITKMYFFKKNKMARINSRPAIRNASAEY